MGVRDGNSDSDRVEKVHADAEGGAEKYSRCGDEREMIVISCIIPGEPVPKARPRAYVTRGPRPFAKVYTPAKTVEAERAVALSVKQEATRRGAQLPTADTLSVSVDFLCSRKPGRRADLDNLVKLVLDALNGIVWKDDAQIVSLHATRRLATDGACTVLLVASKDFKEEMPGPVEETFG